MLNKTNLEQHIKHTGNIYNYYTAQKKNILNDYTYYDDLVMFVQHPDEGWADNNIGTMLDAFKLNYVMVYNLDFQEIYKKKASNKLPEIIIDPGMLKNLYKNRFCDYFTTEDNLVIEMTGATIHYTNDPERIYNPNGFMLIGKIWDEDYIKNLENLTQSNIQIIEPGVIISDTASKSNVISIIPIKGCNSQVLKKLLFSRSFPYMDLFINFSRTSLTISILLALALTLVFILSYQSIIFKPLKIISICFKDETQSRLSEIIKRKDEFSEIGILIKKFFEQKSNLEKFFDENELTLNKLRESEERYRLLFENSMVGIIITKLDNIINANRAALDIFGISYLNEVVNHSIFEFAIPESRKYLVLRMDRISKGLKVEDNYTLKVSKQDGTVRIIDVTTRDVDIQLEKYRLSTIIDITDKTNYENALRHEKAYFEQLFESSPEAIVLTDNNDIILKINKAFTKLFGYIPQEAIGQSTLNLIVPDYLIEESNELNKRITNYETISVETVRKNKFNDNIDVAILGTPIDAGEGLVAIYGMYHNITEQKKVEKILRESKKKAEDSDRLKSSFLANISHEVRTPMNGIIGFTELLRSKHLSQEERKIYLDYINISTNQLLSIFNNLVEISLIESDQLEMRYSECDLDIIMRQLYMNYENERKLKAKEHLTLHYSSPEKNIENNIITDPGRLQQVLSNLISNALKFTVKGTITFGYTLQDDNLLFFVKDTGIGIPEDKFSLIFDHFRQADESTTRLYGGIGLGLPISKGIVEQLGGKIWVTSTLHAGSEFYFTIPYRVAVTPVKKELDDTRLSVISKNDLKGKTVLVAEDADSNYLFIEVLLLKTNAKVIRAINGNEAVKYCRKNKDIDIVLMDLYMPVVSGIEASIQIKSFRPDLPIIALTAYVLENDRERSLEAGCDDYLPKPIDINELFEKLKRYLKIS
jgi:PAS domain S-box-containing protein